MKQKNFEYIDEQGDRLTISSPISASGIGKAYVSAAGSPHVFVDKDDAPVVAAALLRAAGWDTSNQPVDVDGDVALLRDGGWGSYKPLPVVGGDVAKAIDLLELADKEIKTKRCEEAEQRELRVEALKLYNAVHCTTYVNWSALVNPEPWIEAAKVARVIHRTETGVDCG